MELIIFGLIVFGVYKFATRDKTTQQEEETVGVFRDTATKFREDLKPAVAQFKTATTNARTHYEQAQHEKRVNALLNDPELLEAVLRQKLAQQPSLPTSTD